MKFNVELTEQADKDLRSIYLYISVDLNSPENAIKQIKRLWDAILSLDELPQRYRRYEDEPWHSRGIRVLPVDNFVILYIPFVKEKIVRIATVMYSGRNIDEHLSKIGNYFHYNLEIQFYLLINR